jgi:hypothetical protein
VLLLPMSWPEHTPKSKYVSCVKFFFDGHMEFALLVIMLVG